VALRRADLSGKHDPFANILDFIDPRSFCFCQTQARTKTRGSCALGAFSMRVPVCPTWIKLEIHPDRAIYCRTQWNTGRGENLLIKEGFTVLPYIQCGPRCSRNACKMSAPPRSCRSARPSAGNRGGNRNPPANEIIIEQATVPVGGSMPVWRPESGG